MAVTQNTYTGNGSTVLYSFTFPYLDESDIKVEVNGLLTTAYTLANATTIQFNTAPANGALIRIYRATDDVQLKAEFFPGSAVRAQDLNENFNQSLYIAQETKNNSVDPNNPVFLDDVNFNNHKGINVATPTANGDAANKAYVDGLIAAATLADTNYSDIDVSGNGTVWTIVNSAITTGKIADGTIVNTDVNANAAIQASKLSFTQAGAGAVARTVEGKLKEIVSVKDFGATGDGTTNDSVAIQAAIDSLASGGVVYFPPGTYRIARNVGTNDRWGLKITASNITLFGHGAALRRFNTDISTYAIAYPILLIGTPDSNAAAATENTEIIGLTFTGENTRHSTAGSALSDGRYAIALKNTVNTVISDCRFDAIDSEAIFTQSPYTYDYANSAYFNTTKNYRLRIKNCLFNATSHATNGRALLHAINLSGVDDAIVSNNQFLWCDNAVVGSGTYDAPTNTENNTWTPGGGWALGAIKRTGRNWVITGNVVRNSSEHAFYPEGMDVTITGNNIVCESTTICAYDQIKVRSRVCNVTGNTISNCVYGITVSQPAFDVSISGNTINAIGGEGGVIGIEATGLSTYINNRSFLGGNYRPMQNIAITGNTITLQEAAHSSNDGSAIRIYTDHTDANFTYQVRNVSIEGNTIQNHRSGVYIIGNLQATILVKGNVFRAKPFTLGSFSTSTTLNTYATLLINRSGSQTTTTLREVQFTGNYVYGTTYIYATTDGLGSGFETPWGNQSNRFDYVKYIKTSDVSAFSTYNQFTNNSGIYFLDRTWSGSALNNSLFGGAGSYSELRQTFFWSGTNVRFYTDDSGSFVNLN